MSYENKVFQVLVTSGNQALAAAGQSVDDLPVGQLAIVNFDTGKTIATVDNSVKTFQFFVKAPDGDFYKTPEIVKDQIVYAHKANAQEAQPQRIKIKDYKLADCDTTYTLYFQLANTKELRIYSNPVWAKTFSVVVGCPNCDSENPNKLTAALVHAINNDNEGVLKAWATKRSDGSVIADIDAFVASTEGADYSDPANLSDLVVETVPVKLGEICNGISDMYAHPRVTTMDIGLRDGFECNNGTVETLQDPQPAIGSGVDIQHLEMIAGGWNDLSGPYRKSNYGFLPRFNRHVVADPNKNYVQYTLGFEINIPGLITPIPHYNDVIIAVPSEDNTTTGSLDALWGVLTGEAND